MKFEFYENEKGKEIRLLVENLTLNGSIKWRKIYNPFSYYDYKATLGSYKLGFSGGNEYGRAVLSIKEPNAINPLYFRSSVLSEFFEAGIKRKTLYPSSVSLLEELKQLAKIKENQ